MRREDLGGDGGGVFLDVWRQRCLVWQEQELEGSLARFTFVADVTALASLCTFAGDEESLVARYDGLPFVALAFCAPGRRGPRSRPFLPGCSGVLAGLCRQ